MVDVAIIGGGPSGSTLAVLLKKYKPEFQIAGSGEGAFPQGARRRKSIRLP